MNNPLVSVVITTKNEEKNIASCLESIRQQTYPQDKIEVIVVDNNSSDRTKEIARKYTANVFNKGPERSAQRNFGMLQKSQGKYLLYLDADMILSPTVIERSVAKLENGDLVALYIPEVVLGDSFWSKVRRFERGFYNGTVIDCVRIIRRDVFEKVGGFDLSLTGPEDWDLDKKVRSIGRVAVLDSCIYHNEAKFNLKRYLSKKSYYLESFDRYIKKWGSKDPDIRRQLGVGYRLWGVFVENGKWRRLLKHPLLAGGMYFLRVLVGLRFLRLRFQ